MNDKSKLPEFSVFPTSWLGQVSLLTASSTASLYAVHYITRDTNVRRAMRVAQPLNVGVKAFTYGTLLCFGIFTGLLAVSIGVSGITTIDDLKNKLKKDINVNNDNNNEDVKALNKIQTIIRNKLNQYGISAPKIIENENEEEIDWNEIFKESNNNKNNKNNNDDKK